MTPNITEEVFFSEGGTAGKRKWKQMNGTKEREGRTRDQNQNQRMRKKKSKKNERNPWKRKSQSEGLSQTNSEAIGSAPSVSSAGGNATPNVLGEESPCGIIIPHEKSPDQQQPEAQRPKIALSLKWGQPHSVKGKKLPVESVFNKYEDEARKLIPLDYCEDDKNAAKGTVNTEEKHKHVKSLIEKIPTAKPKLFAYLLDWSIDRMTN
ncbi:hypothetical protein GH733_008002 [Mirounga leonina]|nr:hypothetical protein GH733_008002 [Mirounga leonina]